MKLFTDWPVILTWSAFDEVQKHAESACSFIYQNWQYWF